MPWTETRIMDARVKFVSEVLEGIYSMAELCKAYDISRKTGYKWLRRYESEGPCGLSDRSKAPHNHPHAINEEAKQAVLSVKGRFSHWGPAKIRVRLQRQYPNWSCYPAVSTIGEYLKRQGLVCSRKRRHRASPTLPPLTVGDNSNDVWATDFKGHFRTGDGHRCNPLTISDDASRYLLCCRHLDQMSHELVRMQFERVFREYGLPLVIRTDNGEPFSSRGLCGLSRLSYWWIRLGIHPERIMPGHPEHNGRHERMHKTLKKHTANPAALTLGEQQKRFDLFGIEYNQDRPHEALDMHTPASHYKSSARFYPAKEPEVSYPEQMKVCRVLEHGDVYYCGRRFFVTECLSGKYIGIEQIEEDRSRLWYCNYELGTVDHRRWQVTAAKSHALVAGVNPSNQES
jgi:transposase InsO family protein